MHEKLQSPYAKKISKIRSRTVEPVLGTLLNFLNMRRVNTRGIEQATKHVLLAAACYNLKKFMKFSKRRSAIMAIAMPVQQEKTILGIKGHFLALKEAIRGIKIKLTTHFNFDLSYS